jgi:glucuronate isomerase
MSGVRAVICQAIEDTNVIDVHCHLRPQKPAADNLADVVLYHHVWIELVSSGMPVREVTQAGLPHELVAPGMAPLERVRRALPYLPAIESTTSGLLLRWLLRDLYGLERLLGSTLDTAADLVAMRGADPAWQQEVLRRRCHIETSITVEHSGPPYSPTVLLGREGLPLNLQDGKRTPRQVLTGMDGALGREMRTADDCRELVGRLATQWQTEGNRFVGVWPLPYLTVDGIGDQAISDVLTRAREEDRLSPDDLGRFAGFVFTAGLEALRQTNIRTIQLIVGAEVLSPHRALTHWSPSFPGAVGRLAGAFEDFRFNLSSASDLYTQDIAILAKHVPNVSVAGYWWHTFYPYYIRKSLETRLDMVPMNKIVGFFSDAYHAEWCYPKLKLVKRVIEDVLVDRVERGWYSKSVALRLVRRLLHDNAAEIYGLG